MVCRVILGLVVSVLSFVPVLAQEPESSKHAGPEVRFEQDPSANGWEVQVKYLGADDFATTGETWTLDAAKDLVEDIKKQTADLDSALKPVEFLVVGKEGDGKVEIGKGPQIPDFEEVVHRFRTLASERPGEELEAELDKLKSTYEQAEQAIEEALRRRQILSGEELQRVNELTSAYNRQVLASEKVLFQGRKMPYPRFRPITANLPLQTKQWAEARELQYEVERSEKQLRIQGSKLRQEQEQIASTRMQLVFDDSIGKKTETLRARKEKVEKDADRHQVEQDSWLQKMTSHHMIKSELASQVQSIQKDMLDLSAVVPPYAVNRISLMQKKS